MSFLSIEMINNKARHNLIDAKCRWRLDQLDGFEFWGTAWSNESDANPPKGDNPWSLLFSSSIMSHIWLTSICQNVDSIIELSPDNTIEKCTYVQRAVSHKKLFWALYLSLELLFNSINGCEIATSQLSL